MVEESRIVRAAEMMLDTRRMQHIISRIQGDRKFAHKLSARDGSSTSIGTRDVILMRTWWCSTHLFLEKYFPERALDIVHFRDRTLSWEYMLVRIYGHTVYNSRACDAQCVLSRGSSYRTRISCNLDTPPTFASKFGVCITVCRRAYIIRAEIRLDEWMWTAACKTWRYRENLSLWNRIIRHCKN